jgi:perosamine synthetase
MIPVNEPVLTDKDFEFLKDAFTSGWISSAGKYIEEFEQNWAEYCGMRYGISVSNGTAAIQLALDAAGIGVGDEVIMPSFTIISCGQAVTNLGAIPVLVDSDVNTWCMDVTSIESRVTKKTKAIMVVHMYGHPVDMDVVMGIAKKHNILVIEDAAEVHGAKYLSNRGTSSEKPPLVFLRTN